MRAFVAIELPEATRGAIARIQQVLRTKGVRASWVKPENFHLTLRFLGDIDAEQVEALSATLRGICAAHGPAELRPDGAGAFPNARRPGVLWAGLRVLAGDLAGIQGRIESTARGIGLVPETKPFHPHVTVARIRDARSAGPCAEALKACASMGADAFVARHVALFSSQLHPGGSVYTRLETYLLEGSDGR